MADTLVMKILRRIPPVFLISAVNLIVQKWAYAESSGELIQRGLAKTLFSSLQLPATIVQHTTAFFPLGILTGTVQGTLEAVIGTLSGAVDLAAGAAPYAKYAAFFL